MLIALAVSPARSGVPLLQFGASKSEGGWFAHHFFLLKQESLFSEVICFGGGGKDKLCQDGVIFKVERPFQRGYRSSS